MDEQDFDYTANQYGYIIKYKNKNIGGAGVLGKPSMHWRHARQNVSDNGCHARNDIDKILRGQGQPRYLKTIKQIDKEG